MSASRIILFATSCLFLVACAAKVRGLQQSDSFTPGAAVSGKFAVGGVVSLTASDAARESAFATSLRATLLEERPTYTVAPQGTVAERLGKASHDAVLNEYKTQGSLSDGSLNALRDRVQGFRYIVFARIEVDATSNDRQEISNKNNKGREIPGTGRVTSITERSVETTIHVYDTQTKGIAWTAQLSKSLRNSREFRREAGLITAVRVVTNAATSTESDAYPYPPAPETGKVLEEIFDKFAESMPKS